jgi:putative addiction module component (TIGR02574 family)
MTNQTENILKQALSLSERERADLACSLIDSLDSELDEGAAEAWNEEIAKRIKDLNSGEAKTVPWKELQRRVSARLPNAKTGS